MKREKYRTICRQFATARRRLRSWHRWVAGYHQWVDVFVALKSTRPDLADRSVARRYPLAIQALIGAHLRKRE